MKDSNIEEMCMMIYSIMVMHTAGYFKNYLKRGEKIMAHKFRILPYTLVTMASICLMGGLYVLTGGEEKHVRFGEYHIHN